MAEHIQKISNSIQAKIGIILERQNMLVQQITNERKEVATLRAQVEALTAEIQKLKAENEYLTVMRGVAVTPQQAEQSRAMLSGLVREIDRCIAELKAC
jgi:cell division protein FtsB